MTLHLALRRVAPAVLLLGLLAAPAAAQAARDPALPIAWNRFYDYDGIVDLCRRLAEHRPDLCRLEFIGESVEGRPLPLLVLHDPRTGDELSKPAMWIDGNIHGNEVQGAEAAVYVAWLLLERNGDLPGASELLSGRVFYILPMVNPDGRQWWFEQPNTASSSRSGKRPVDDDRDGLLDEDGADDLDGDGEILLMRKQVPPGTGTHRLSPTDPRVLVPVPAHERLASGADWVQLGREGTDEDGDGRVNEDGPGGYDMNRNWPAGWRPSSIQYGAGEYPFSFPETEAVGRFLAEHPNVAAVQSFHNSGGMILRGPGNGDRAAFYPAADRAVYDAIAREGEGILPHYDYLVIHEGLYDVHGGFVNFTAETLGIVSFSNEMWSGDQYFGERGGDDLSFGDGMSTTERRLFFDDRLLLGETFVDWHDVQHPTYGTVQVGGFRKMTGRVPPPFMIEEMLHRNAAFCLYHASQMPKLSLLPLQIERGPGDVSVVTLEVRNERWIPTRTAVAAERGIGRPDLVTIEGDDLVVLAGGPGADRFDLTVFDAVEHEPARLRLERGIPGHGSERLRWIVRGSGGITVTVDAHKGGRLAATGTL